MANKVKFSSEQEVYILDLYQQGYTVNSIAIEMGAAFDTVKKVVGSEFQSQQGVKSNKISCPNITMFIKMVTSNEYSLDDVCQYFNVSRTVVYRWIREHGLTFVKKKPPPKIESSVYEKLLDKDWITNQYNLHGTKKLGEMLGLADGTVGRYLEKHSVPRDKVFSCSVSVAELEVADFISDHFMIVKNDRKIVPPYELDIFIPNRNLAIEYNGLYWHSEKNKSSNYHYDKWLHCQKNGINLIQIWEDDWIYKKPLVRNMLLHKLGISDCDKIYARNCFVEHISQSQLNDFMNLYHIQGTPAVSSVRLGLFFGNQIVAAVSFTKAKEYYTLTRYATSCTVVGGFTKLLSYFEKLGLTSQIVTFADLTVSNGKLYDLSGFTVDKILPPDYCYYVGKRRVHKFNYRKSRFKKDPNLLFSEGLTEKELAILNKLYRIYDAGKVRYVKKLDDMYIRN